MVYVSVWGGVTEQGSSKEEAVENGQRGKKILQKDGRDEGKLTRCTKHVSLVILTLTHSGLIK